MQQRVNRLITKEGFFYRNRYIFLAFFVPFALLFYGFATGKFFPFGDNQIAVIDFYHQYYPFLDELQSKLQNGGSLLYSWNGGLGTNFISLMAYYAASPLYLLTVLVPSEYLMEAVTLIIMVKISLGGAFMAIYLKGMHGKCDLGTVAFSTLYALCAYVMGYYWCLMWLDVVALLPLCLLGLNRLIKHGDFKLYTISIAVMMFTNYYIGGMACIFILFYYPILYFSKDRIGSARECIQTTGRAIFFSLMGILMAAVLLIPTFINLNGTYYIDSEMPAETTFYRSILDILTNLLPDTPVTVREGLPNLYCGLLAVILLIFFMLSKTIPLRKKLLNCVMLAFLIISLNWNKLDFIWHGLHFPNQLPFRYSFVFSFLLIILAYEAFLKIKEITLKQIGAITAGGMLYLLLTERLYKETMPTEFIYICLMLLFLYMGLFALYRTGKITRTLFCFFILLAVFGEMAGHVTTGIRTVDHTSRSQYFSDNAAVEKLVANTKKKDKDFYRMELSSDFTLNSPMLYNYPGASQFSSTVTAKVSDLMENIGLEAQDAKNRYNYQLTNPVTNAMLNIKYIIGKGASIEDEDALSLVDGIDTTTLYQSKYPLSVGYMASDSIVGWNHKNENPFTVLNDFTERSVEQDAAPVFEPIAKTQTAKNGTQLVFTPDKPGQVYVFVETDEAKSITAQREYGSMVQLKEDCGAIESVGKCEAGEKITIDVTFEEGKKNDITARVYSLDTSAWDRIYRELADETLKVSEYSDTKIKGSIYAKQQGYFLTSVPYERGWTLKVDGEVKPISLLGGAFISVPLTAGQHDIELTYIPEGFVLGALISISSIGIFVALCLLIRRKREDQSDELIARNERLLWASELRRRRKI